MAGIRGVKAQIMGQVFIFILAGLIFILIMGYGYKAISYFMERQEQVILVDFRNDLELAVEGVKRDFGTVRRVNLKLPSEFLGVCFFDPVTCAKDEIPVISLPGQESLKVSWAKDACETQSENVFIIPRSGEKLYFDDISVDGYLCIANSDGIRLRMEGTGKKAKVSEWKVSEREG